MKIIDSSSPVEPILCMAHRLESIANKFIFKPMGLSSISFKILKILKFKGSMTASDLTQITNATKSNMSQRLSFLEKENYVSRTYASDTSDRRKVMIQLTSSGKERITDLEKRIRKAQISFEKKFSEKELTAHMVFFKKLSDILDNGESELEKLFKL